MRRPLLASLLLFASTLSFPQVGFLTKSYTSPNDRHVIARDMNRDGVPDLVLFGGPLNLRFNDGRGNFGPALPVAGASADFVAVADFNKDGLPDIATCTRATSGFASTVNVYLNHGGGSFTKSYSTSLAFKCAGVMASDVNGNGKADIVVAGTAGTPTTNFINTYFGDGAGKFGAPVHQTVSVERAPGSDSQGCLLGGAVGADFQAAGRLDLVLTGDCSGDYFNEGTIYYAQSDKAGHYALRELYEDTGQWDYNLPYISDVDSTGRPDVVLTWFFEGPHGTLRYNLDFLVNQGGGAFALKHIWNEWNSAPDYYSVIFSGAAGDFNGDKIDDAVVGFTESPDGSTPAIPGLMLRMGYGHFNYFDSQHWALNSFPYATMAADLNHDGRLDIVTLIHNNDTNANAMKVYLNQGTVPLCAAPSTPGVHVCTPEPFHQPKNGPDYGPPPPQNNVYSSPVKVVAAAKPASGKIARYEIWIDSTKRANYTTPTLNTAISLATGTHQISIHEVDTNGGVLKSTPVAFDVK